MAFNKYGEWCLIPVSINVGAAAPTEYSFKIPFSCRAMALRSAADAADGTDKVTVSLVVGGTTVITGTVNAAADTVVSNESPDSGQVLTIAADTLCKLVLTYAGTAANVKGVNIHLWVQPTR
jgi:hypothetical protein